MNELDRQICITYIAEYIDFRTREKWSGFLRNLFKKITDSVQIQTFASKRQAECESLIEKIKAAQTYDDYIEILDIAGEHARVAQLGKPQTYLGANISFFIEENSLWAKTLHAVRTRLVYSLLNSDHKTKFQAEIESLRAIYKAKDLDYERHIIADLDTKKLEKEREDTFYKLLDRQDWPSIVLARKDARFPKPLPSYEKIQISDKVIVKKAIPTVYNSNYYNVYTLNDITADPHRLARFNALFQEGRKNTESIKEFDIEEYVEGLQALNNGEITFNEDVPTTPLSDIQSSTPSNSESDTPEVKREIKLTHSDGSIAKQNLFQPMGLKKSNSDLPQRNSIDELLVENSPKP